MTTRLRFASLLALVCALLPCTAAVSQQTEGLSPGMRVRLQVAAAQRATGTILSVGARTFGFQPEDRGDTIFVDYARVQRIDVSQGRHHRIVRDAVLGGIGGLVIGGVIGAASHADFPSSEVVIPPDDQGGGEGGGCTIRDPNCTQPEAPPQQPTVEHREPTSADLRRTARSAAIGVAAGVVVGAIVGRLLKSEVWEKLPSDRNRVQVTLAPPSAHHIGLGLRLGIAIR